MPRDAVVLMDLQIDYFETFGRRPLAAGIVKRLIEVANSILAGGALPDALPVLVASHFSPNDRIGNYFRKRAAISGTRGAQIDPRLEVPQNVRTFVKSRSSAFSSPDFERYLRENDITRLILIGVTAEGSVRATAREGVRRGFDVLVPLDAVATDSHLKMSFARLAMLQADVRIVRKLSSLLPPSTPSEKETP